MEDLRSLETGVLIDMLALRTKEYTEMLFNDQKDGIKDLELILYHLQNEINARKTNSSTTDPGIKFTDTDLST